MDREAMPHLKQSTCRFASAKSLTNDLKIQERNLMVWHEPLTNGSILIQTLYLNRYVHLVFLLFLHDLVGPGQENG